MGLYGVIAYDVKRRTREIGVRIALGARPAQVLNLFLKQGVLLVLIGSVAGFALALAATRLLVSYLFGVHPFDPASFGGGRQASYSVLRYWQVMRHRVRPRA